MQMQHAQGSQWDADAAGLRRAGDGCCSAFMHRSVGAASWSPGRLGKTGTGHGQQAGGVRNRALSAPNLRLAECAAGVRYKRLRTPAACSRWSAARLIAGGTNFGRRPDLPCPTLPCPAPTDRLCMAQRPRPTVRHESC